MRELGGCLVESEALGLGENLGGLGDGCHDALGSRSLLNDEDGVKGRRRSKFSKVCSRHFPDYKLDCLTFSSRTRRRTDSDGGKQRCTRYHLDVGRWE
jgi:hypothetical protein